MTKFILDLLLPVKPNGIILMCWHRELLSKIIKSTLIIIMLINLYDHDAYVCGLAIKCVVTTQPI